MEKIGQSRIGKVKVWWHRVPYINFFYFETKPPSGYKIFLYLFRLATIIILETKKKVFIIWEGIMLNNTSQPCY